MPIVPVTLSLLSPLYNLFGWFLGLLYDWIGNYGIVIILFTIVLRALLIPLGLKSTKSMVKQQALQPDINEIKRIYAKDPQKQQQMQMELMKKHNISMAGGCLPSLLQLIIIWPIFTIFRAPLQYIGRVSVDFVLKIADILFGNQVITEQVLKQAGTNDIPILNGLRSSASSLAEAVNSGLMKMSQLINTEFLGMDLSRTPSYKPGDWFGPQSHIYLPLLILPILTIVTMLIQMRITRMTTLAPQISKEERERERRNPAKAGQTPKDPSAGMMKTMGWMMPLLMMVTVFTMPAAMGIYWVMANIMYILQSWLGYTLYVRPIKAEQREAALRYDKSFPADSNEKPKRSFFDRFRTKAE
jgi:YidC/Oxa1 family membrane protein insertase